MLKSINDAYNASKNSIRADQAIVESVVEDDEEILPGSDEEIDDVVDVDSIPDQIYRQVDSALDKLIGNGDIGDEEIEELLDSDEDVDEDSVSDAQIDAMIVGDEAPANAKQLTEAAFKVISEAANKWYDDENIGHPNTDRRDGTVHQPLFRPTGKFDAE